MDNLATHPRTSTPRPLVASVIRRRVSSRGMRSSYTIVIRDPKQALAHLCALVVGLTLLFAYILVAKPGISADAWRARAIPSYPSNAPEKFQDPVKRVPSMGNDHFQYASRRLTKHSG